MDNTRLTEEEARAVAADLNLTEERIAPEERWTHRVEEDTSETRPDRWTVRAYDHHGERPMRKLFTLQVETESAAFEDPSELPALLRKAAQKIEDGERSAYLLDTNGNRVGSFTTRDVR